MKKHRLDQKREASLTGTVDRRRGQRDDYFCFFIEATVHRVELDFSTQAEHIFDPVGETRSSAMIHR